ncbi:hypothetical protein Rt10032_c20g6318 [Rhodotorula toruloides]|uniref:Uncharacterized protein n=1 Tax=Rhodotorula toruloides TaxID=5286 RepID=A0A511KPM5_RHOTO|nr:hypothetical protein Rt10032_c20g6318 [Rhodotorula toruloides]
MTHSGPLPRPYHPPCPPHPRRHQVIPSLFYLASTLEATTSTSSTPQLVVVEGLGGQRAGLLWVKVGVLAVLALASQSNSRHQAQRFRLIHSAPSSFVYIFSLGNHGRPSRILHCHAPTAVRWRSQRTLSFSTKQVIEKEDTRLSGA